MEPHLRAGWVRHEAQRAISGEVGCDLLPDWAVMGQRVGTLPHQRFGTGHTLPIARGIRLTMDILVTMDQRRVDFLPPLH